MVAKKTTSTTTSTGRAKAAGPRTAAAKPPKPAKAARAKVQGVTLGEPAMAAEDTAPAGPKAMTKKELLARVRKTSGVKGGDVRQVVDAVLEELGEALGRGESLRLQPLGTLRVQRQKVVANGDILVLKLRRKKPAPGDKDPLAEAAE